MTNEARKLTEEELEAQIGAALPDREAMSILPVVDPLGGGLPIHHFDAQHEPGSADEADAEG